MTLDFGWRKFNFFDKSIIHDKETPSEKFLGLKDVDVDYWCCTGDAAYLGESKGGVFRLSNQMDEYYWKAYQKSLASLHSAGKYLFSVGEDEEMINSLLKIWDPEKLDKSTPTLKREVKMSPLLTSSCPACHVAVHSTLTSIAVGFADGAVLFYQGDVVNDKALNSRWLRVREPAPLEGAVTGLAIAYLPGNKSVVFVITAKCVYSYVVESRAVTLKKKHDANGASHDCWTFYESTGQLVVASREMVYFYEADQTVDVDGGQGRCLQLGRGNEKLQLVAAGEHLALLTKQQALIPSDTEFMTMITVYDIKGQYIGFSCSLPSLCRMFVIGNSMLILSTQGTLSELTEKNLSAKLDILFKKNLFDVAVILAKHNKDGAVHLKSIHAKYADYLYGKGDFENAINQYKETIGMLEPSYVIKKYLDGTKIVQLCVYLESLHDAGKENSHHTSILLNAYARRGAKRKMMEFIDWLASSRRNFDMRPVFNILCQWKFLPEASLLATKLGMHEESLETIIGHMQNYAMAVKYISKRPPEETIKYLEKYGRILLEKCREETMSLLFDCIARSNEANLELKGLLDLFIGDTEGSEAFIAYAIQKTSGTTKKELVDMILEIRLRAFSNEKSMTTRLQELIVPLINESNAQHALNMAQTFNCSPIVEYVLKTTKRTKELMAFYTKNNQLLAIIKLCEEAQKSDLWIDALSYVAKMEHIEDESVVLMLLDTLEKSQVVHPLVVLEVLSKSNTLTIAAVKQYVVNWLERQEAKIAEDNKKIKENEKRMLELDKQIESIKFNPQVLQVSKCSACDTSLQLPAVHFLCRHSYHVHCFESYSERADHCPICANKSRNEDREDLSDRVAYNKFQSELKDSGNSMDVISKYMQMGLFDEHRHHKKRDASKRAALQSGSRPSTTLTNPFDDEPPASVSRTVSSASTLSRPATSVTPRTTIGGPSHSDRSNPFDVDETPRATPSVPLPKSTPRTNRTGYDDAKNPFGGPPKNPFDED